MPDEPLQDTNTGLEYYAYLMEIRSIGGLSGSPVYVFFPLGRFHEGTYETQRHVLYLIGLVRGHWTREAEEFADFGETEVDQLNTGIAIVTPVQKAIEIIMNTEELMRDRKKSEQRRSKRDAPVEDSALPEEDAEFNRFEKFAQGLINVPKKEIDEERKRETS